MSAIDLSVLTPPALPDGSLVVSGAWASSNDGSTNRLGSSTLSAAAQLALYPLTPYGAFTVRFIAYFVNSAAPATSYIYPGICKQPNGDEYEIVLSRGTGETRGALWVQKTGSDLGPTYVGTSGTTFAQNTKYEITASVSGTTTRVFAVSAQRLTDGYWLTSAGAWQAAQTVALNVTDSSPIGYGGACTLNIYASAVDSYLYVFSVVDQNISYKRTQATPVITKGATYNGILADSLAAPAACFNGASYALTVSIWNITNAKWYSVFFTSADLKTWTYVSGSLLSPGGTDYILGNAGLEYFSGKYWFAYNHYPSAGTPAIGLQYSTDLLTWNNVNTSLIASAADPDLVYNPISGLLELWYIGTTDRAVYMYDSPDGLTWTSRGKFMDVPAVCKFDFGEPSVYYQGNTRYLTHDCSVTSSGDRFSIEQFSVNRDTTWVMSGVAIAPWSNAFESTQTFDADVVMADLSDGRGKIPRMLYAGSDIVSATNNTDSSIGYAEYAKGGQKTLLALQAVNRGSTY